MTTVYPFNIRYIRMHRSYTLGRIWYHYFLSHIYMSIYFTWTRPFSTAISCFQMGYKVQKETPFHFQDSICDRAPRLTYVGGQEVISRNFIFPPCLHFLYLGAKLHSVYGNINFEKYISTLERYLFTCFCALALVNLLQKAQTVLVGIA